MRILHYIPSLDRSSGGTATYLQLLGKELGKLVDLHIATHPSDHPVPIVHAEVHYISASLMGGMLRDWKGLLDMLRSDVVHINCCWIPQCALAQRVARQAGYKVVLTPHGMLEPWIMARHYWTRKVPALWLYQKRAVKKADYLHATAESEKENLLKLGYNDRVAVIANGIEVEGIRMKTSWKRTGKILFLSRIHVKKGVDYLIEAFTSLKEVLGSYELWIAGEGDAAYIEKLKLLADEWGIGRQVHFLGGVYGDEKWGLFRQSDLFVLPTHSENFGIVVAEALACGTPVITTKGAPWQDLQTWNCGWWIERNVGSLVYALNEFLELSEGQLEQMGRNGRRLIEKKYSSVQMARQMLALYKDITGK